MDKQELEKKVDSLEKRIEKLEKSNFSNTDYKLFTTDSSGTKIPTPEAREIIQKLKKQGTLKTRDVMVSLNCSRSTARDKVMPVLADYHEHISYKDRKTGHFLSYTD